MTRCTIGLLVTLSLGLAAPLATDAQPMTKMARVGVLFVGPPPSSPDRQERSLFLQALRTLGGIEGQNLIIEHRWASERSDRLADLAAELVRLG